MHAPRTVVTMASNSLPISLAIVVGCSLIAAAIVVTLGKAPAATPAPAAVAPAAPPTAPVRAEPLVSQAAAATGMLPPLPPVAASVLARGTETAARALERLRPQFVSTCWTSPTEQEPQQIVLAFSLSFSPEGRLIGWGISEARDAARMAVANCIREQKLDAIAIPAPGAPLSVEVPFTLP
jgi:hypothetical protein